MPNLLEELLGPACRLINSLKLVLSCSVGDKLTTKEEAFRVNLCARAPQNHFGNAWPSRPPNLAKEINLYGLKDGPDANPMLAEKI